MERAPIGTDAERGWMEHALHEAALALVHDDVPVGAIVVNLETGEIVARAHNRRELDHDPTAHAEIVALREAARAAGTWRLSDHALIVTLEPCVMCAGAAWSVRIDRVVFGAADPKAGATGSLYNFAADPRLNHATDVVAGVRAQECADLLTTFFKSRRTS